ncbi:ABC transporter substrate-binding protein [Kribbella sp. NBC_00709]|uniref:ABC transporter substrate-binding protein n=1 Tax=Kribbella sp. NBC_00709 TaxID=2975972 RepID=UPI002E2DFE96|nr:ABC transporter substrate-binding protein [Kribbella sp. NBC_00709]
MRSRMKLTAVVAGLAVLSGLTACSSGGAAGAAGSTPPLTVAAYSQPTLQPNFNPFSVNALRGTIGLIYEQLFDFNTAHQNEFMPSLVTKYTWAAGGKAIDLALDNRAKWSDGSALTADDVIFTFGYLKQHQLQALPVDQVTKTADGVHLTFTKPAYAAIQDLGRTVIVPKKIWATKDPDTDTNLKPMGSGPYSLGQVTGQQATFTARSDYWKQKVPVPQITYVTTSSTNLLTQQLVRHEIDLAYAGIPDVKNQFVQRAPAQNHLWPIYASMKPLMLNLKRKPFDNVHVRKGLALAIDRQAVTDAYNPGVYAPVGPTGLYQGTWASWIAPTDRDPVKPDKAAALAEFAQAGYKQQGGKLIGADGKQLKLRILTVSAFADGMAYSQELAGQLAALGIDAAVNGVPSAAYTGDEDKRDFDAIYGDAFTFGTNPYTFYSKMLSAKSKTNVVGWDDPATESALGALAQAAPDAQPAAAKPLQQIMLNQLPVIPVAVKGTPYMYNTEHWTGWPSAENPYTTPDPGAISGVYAAKLFLSLKPA